MPVRTAARVRTTARARARTAALNPCPTCATAPRIDDALEAPGDRHHVVVEVAVGLTTVGPVLD